MPNLIKGCDAPQSEDAKLSSQATASINSSHPIPAGTIVYVPQIALLRRPFIEGRAHIIKPVIGEPDIYRVRFKGERVDQVRFIIGGAFQRHAEECIASLHTHWLASLRHAEHLQALLRSEEGGL